MALDTILLATSQTPIGRTPGFLFRTMSLQARKGAKIVGSINCVQILRARRASEWHSSSEVSLFHAWAFKPDGPAEPFVCLAEWHIRLASIHSKITGLARGGVFLNGYSASVPERSDVCSSMPLD